jgi:ABC-type lipoprotein export system ATPase subunit
LADEPTGSLDQENARQLLELLLELQDLERISVVMVTHAQPLAARMRRVLTLRQGHLEAPV